MDSSSDKDEADEFQTLNKSFKEFELARKRAMAGAKEMSDMIKAKILDTTLQGATLGSEKAIQSTYDKLVNFQKEVKGKIDKLNNSLQAFVKVCCYDCRSTTTQ